MLVDGALQLPDREHSLHETGGSDRVATGDEATGFSITAGDPDSAFAIDASGQITVADESKLDFETTPSYSPTVEATDGTTPITMIDTSCTWKRPAQSSS